MLNRKTLFSLFAVVAFAAAASLTVNSANAVPKGGPGAFKGNVGKGGGGGAWPGGKGPGGFKGNPPGKGGGAGPGKGGGGPKWGGPKWGGKLVLKPSWCFKHPWRCRARVVAYPVVTGVAAAAIARPAAPCTCLTKTYLPNGAVMFKDVCTQEVAINPPAQAAEAPQ